jgi:hypothetical protein
MLAGRFDIEVASVDRVALDDDVRAAIAVNAVGIVLISLPGIVNGADVLDRVPADFSIAREVH